MHPIVAVACAVVWSFVIAPDVFAQSRKHSDVVLAQSDPRSSIQTKEASPIKAVLDWRELPQWKISQAAMPAERDIKLAPELIDGWHYARIIAMYAAVIVLLGLITTAGYEHWRRRIAEQVLRKRISELAHVGRRALAGELSAAIAHELNQPLGSILNDVESAELLLQAPQPNIDQLRQLIGDIGRSDRRASDIIRNLRALMSKQPEEFVTTDLAQIATEAVELAAISAKTSGVTIHLTIPFGLYIVMGAPIQLQQVFLNLVINGIDAVKTRSVGHRDVVVSATEVNDKLVEIAISDSGAGISPENLEQIFRPFFTTKENGMGMGLSLCQTIVEAHDGSISAANGFSGGATVRFRLPLKDYDIMGEFHESATDSARG